MFAAAADYKHCLSAFLYLQSEYGFDIRGFCLMPDYLKFVISLDACEISKELVVLGKDDKLFVWKKIVNIFPKAMPLKGQCVRIADCKRLLDVLQYIESEPVRAGIVASCEQYRFSSAYGSPLSRG